MSLLASHKSASVKKKIVQHGESYCCELISVDVLIQE